MATSRKNYQFQVLLLNRTASKVTEILDRLTIFRPFSGVDPGILPDRKDANAAAQLFDSRNKISHIAPGIFWNQIEAVATHDIHAGIHEKAVQRLFCDAA